jgi:hypothetical protein
MKFRLTPVQRRMILQFVADHSPDGEPFRIDDLKSLPPLISDLGRGLLELACEDLCGMEDPDIVWSTPEGMQALQSLRETA